MKVGYVQGHNFIARLVLDLIEDEEDSFWVYCFVIEECFSVSYFINLNNLMLDSLMFRILLQAVEPRVALKLRNIRDFDLDLITFKWFLCLYADSGLPFDHTNKIWDLLILGDRLVYMKAGFVILRQLGPRLAEVKELSDAYSLMDQLRQVMGSDSAVFIKKVSEIYINERILDIIRVSNQSKLQRLAAMMKIGKDEEEEKTRRTASRRRLTPCSGKTITCAETREAAPGPEREFFSFCSKGFLKNKIFNYFSTENGFWEENKKRRGATNKENDMLVHRSKHTCVKHEMQSHFQDYEAAMLETDFSSLDIRRTLLESYAGMMYEGKLQDEIMREDLEEPSEDESVKTVKREHGSSRFFRFNNTLL